VLSLLSAKCRAVYVDIGSSRHSLVNGDGPADDSRLSVPCLPAASRLRPTAPPYTRVRCSSLSSDSSALSTQLWHLHCASTISADTDTVLSSHFRHWNLLQTYYWQDGHDVGRTSVFRLLRAILRWSLASGDSSMPYFTPSVQGWGVCPRNCKFKILEYKHSAGVYPFVILTKFLNLCGQFHGWMMY